MRMVIIYKWELLSLSTTSGGRLNANDYHLQMRDIFLPYWEPLSNANDYHLSCDLYKFLTLLFMWLFGVDKGINFWVKTVVFLQQKCIKPALIKK